MRESHRIRGIAPVHTERVNPEEEDEPKEPFAGFDHLSAGARFFRADLHIHSFGVSADVTDPKMSVAGIVRGAREHDLDLIAITDHNAIDSVEPLLELASNENLIAFPGVELTSAEGHVLVYFPPEDLDGFRRWFARLEFVEGSPTADRHVLTPIHALLKEVKVLHAMQCESPASSYLWLFDEPGIHLHPDGQRDLIQVMETLSETNQVLYTTHSIFLANQNYPTRHRLLMRTKAGTDLDSKPYVSRWRTALAALGFSLAGTVLFAPHVLLVEGDSDAIYVTAILRRLIADGHLDLDLNRFSVIPTGDSANTGALIRILTDGIPASTRPTLGLLVDGDKGGKARLKAVKSLIKEHRIAAKEFSPANTTTEDHLPAAKRLYLEAVVGYLTDLCNLGSHKQEELRASFASRFGDSEPVGLAEWTREEAKEIAGLEEKPSPVGIARAYAEQLEELEVGELKPREASRAKKLAQWIGEEIKVPIQTLAQDRILESGEES